MDSEDHVRSTVVHGVEAADPAVDDATPRDTIFPGDEVARGDSAPPQDLVLPRSSAASGDMGPPRDSDPGEPAALRLRHADSAVSPPRALVVRLTHWSMLAIGIPLAVGAGWLAVLSYRDGERLASLAFISGVLLGCLLVYWWRRMRLVADRDGILIRQEFRSHRIPWSDLDYIEFDVRPATPDFPGATTLVFVTREQVRIREPNLLGSTEPGGDLYKLAESLLAMRDAYAPAPGHPGTAPTDPSDG